MSGDLQALADQMDLHGVALLSLPLEGPAPAIVLGACRFDAFGGWLPDERELLMVAAQTLTIGIWQQRHVRRLSAAALGV